MNIVYKINDKNEENDFQNSCNGKERISCGM